ncbi:LysM peptidoglycan-binding domain-containing protein [Bacillaceae bacterium SIJ1]|uniref:choice-of-anchor I family protein n=1 Tax=Litoribacterium kuwaitense TaxID=1398745 RepID=UPI0013EB9CC6|nr:choice-of-anchor I family protein [Litoribacterium kuwaitense]NGP44819.1 LysM peptidoglycan-binding domain-containing protein [Litoribacterium kuwaitense]
MRVKQWVRAGLAASIVMLPTTGQATDNDVTTYSGEMEPSFAVEMIGRYTSGAELDEGGAEIVAYDQARKQAYSINGAEKALDIIDLSILEDNKPFSKLSLKKRVGLNDVAEEMGPVNGLTSVDVHPTEPYLAVSIVAEPKTDKGYVVFISTDGEVLSTVQVGSQPDMITFTHDGSRLLVANEGEPNDAYDINPEGSVSIIDVGEGVDHRQIADAKTVKFDDDVIDDDVRQVHEDSDRVADLEPEYIAVTEDDRTAYVVLQESNAIATLDLATESWTSVKSLGYKDHSLAGNGMDASDKDGKINIQPVPVLGQYMPDAISLLESNGKTYIVTPNEGDAQDYEGFSEEVRVADIAEEYDLDASLFAGFTEEEIDTMVENGLFDDDQLGRLRTTTSSPVNEEGKYEAVYGYGARSFTIFDASTMKPVFDSGDQFEKAIAEAHPELFNTDNAENAFDNRSDNKGPEPEAAVVGQIGDRTYAFIGLERDGSIAVYDVTQPSDASFVQLFSSRDFSGSELGGDIAPEGLEFVSAKESLTGHPLLIVGNEVSGTVAVYEFLEDSEEGTSIQIIHFNDVHARVFSEENAGIGYAKLKTIIEESEEENPNTLVLDAGDTLHGTTFATLMKGESIVQILNAIDVDALAPGNHDFNYGKDHLQALQGLMDFPVLAANVLKEDGSSEFQPYEIQEIDGVQIGIFGLASPETTYKTHPDNVKGLTFEDPVDAAKRTVSQLEAEGADIIIALAHVGLDESSEDTSDQIAAQVPGIDLIVDGHSHTTLPEGMDAENGTLIVSAGEYLKNVGVVELQWDGDKVIKKDAELITKEDAKDVIPNEDIVAVTDDITAEQDVILQEVVGTTEVALHGERGDVRTQETNLGNLIADAMLDLTGADVALTNGGGIRASIDAGEVTKGEVVTVLPFGNYIVTKQISGTQLKEALERGMSSYPESLGAFPQVGGMTFKVDPNQPAGSRVHSLMINDEPVDLEKTYMLATNDFLAAGGDDYTSLAQSPIDNEYDALDEALIDYMKKIGTTSPTVEGRITEGTMSISSSEQAQETRHEQSAEQEQAKADVYIVQPGDNLYEIGLQHGTTWRVLQQMNQLPNPHIIQIGQEIRLP